MSAARGITLHRGDCLNVLDTLPANSVDAVITDPPYHLTSIVKRFGGKGAAAAQHGTDGAFARASRGFMGQEWDGGDVAFQVETWAKVLRVLKPGGYMAAFSHARTYHRMACAIEDAGFDIRDQIEWLYGCAMPKSHNIARGIDKVLGVEGTLGGPRTPEHEGRKHKHAGHAVGLRPWMSDPVAIDRNNREYIPASPQAQAWQGAGTALKPGHEPAVLAIKPVEAGSYARQCLATGTGGLHIDAARVARDVPKRTFSSGRSASKDLPLGRWPANVAHDGSPEVRAALPEGAADYFFEAVFGPDDYPEFDFHYSGKAGAADRVGSDHPTVKPQSLMRWLVRLLSIPGGVILDPFAGSGSTGWAAEREGRECVLIERDAAYSDHIERRIADFYTPTTVGVDYASGPDETAVALVQGGLFDRVDPAPPSGPSDGSGGNAP